MALGKAYEKPMEMKDASTTAHPQPPSGGGAAGELVDGGGITGPPQRWLFTATTGRGRERGRLRVTTSVLLSRLLGKTSQIVTDDTHVSDPQLHVDCTQTMRPRGLSRWSTNMCLHLDKLLAVIWHQRGSKGTPQVHVLHCDNYRFQRACIHFTWVEQPHPVFTASSNGNYTTAENWQRRLSPGVAVCNANKPQRHIQRRMSTFTLGEFVFLTKCLSRRNTNIVVENV